MKPLVITAAILAALALPACGRSAPAPKSAPSAAAAASPTETTITLTPKGGCADEVTWRDSGGIAHLVKVERWLGRVAADETSGNTAALQPDGTKLYAAAVSAAADPPPIDRGMWLKALRLAEKATVDAQAGDYQASSTAITETGDLFSVMISDLKAKCGA